jgi:hypothetical protein
MIISVRVSFTTMAVDVAPAETPLVLHEMGSGTRDVLERFLQRLGLAVTPAVEPGG